MKGEYKLLLPSIPNLTPDVGLAGEEKTNLMIESIAIEEVGLAHIINTNGVKIQYVFGTAVNTRTIKEVLTVNERVQEMLAFMEERKLLSRGKLI